MGFGRGPLPRAQQASRVSAREPMNFRGFAPVEIKTESETPSVDTISASLTQSGAAIARLV
jgi:hypothetical protein